MFLGDLVDCCVLIVCFWLLCGCLGVVLFAGIWWFGSGSLLLFRFGFDLVIVVCWLVGWLGLVG